MEGACGQDDPFNYRAQELLSSQSMHTALYVLYTLRYAKQVLKPSRDATLRRGMPFFVIPQHHHPAIDVELMHVQYVPSNGASWFERGN